MQQVAEKIAGAVRDLECTIEKAPASASKKRIQAKARVVHRLLEQAAKDHGPAMGIDVAPLSGGGVKPN